MSNIDYEKELNEEQLSAVRTTDGPLRIIAGAGSGKTRTLIYRVAWMLEHGIDPRNILLLTFTNKAALAFLKCIANPHNEIAFFRALKKYPAIGDTFAQRISELIIKSGYSGLVENPYKKRAFYPDMVALKGKLEEWQQMDFPQVMESVEKYYSALCERVINEMKLEDESRRDELLSENDSHSEDFNTLNIMAKEHRTLTGFLDKLTLEANVPTADDDALHISTIHSAKGLEFPIVIILDCADGIFPRVTCENEHSEDDEEELRCFYVAMTRAKNQLYMIQPEYATRYGHMEQVALSHYLTGEEEYFELVDETGEGFLGTAVVF